MVLTPANSNTNQNSYAKSDRDCAKRAVFGPSCNPTQSIIADPGPDLDRLIPQTSRLVDRRALTTTEAIYEVIHDRPDGVGNLIPGRKRSSGCLSAGVFSNSAELLFDGS